MHTLNSYILRLMMRPFLFVVFVLLLALSLERLLRLIEVVGETGAPLSHVFELLFYLIPHYLGLALPAAGFLAVLLAFRALYENAELDILQSSGIGLRQILTPVILFSCGVSVFVLALVAFIQPHTRYVFGERLHVIQEQPLDLNIRAAAFQSFGERITIRVDENRDGVMRGFFAAINHKDGGVSYLSAARAEIVPAQNDDDVLTLQLIDGRRVSRQADGAQSVFEFAVFPWKVNAGLVPYGPRGQDVRELTVFELGKSAQHRAEFHGRLAHALSLPFLALLAIPLALIGQGRTGKAGGVVIGVIVVVLYEKILGFGEAFAISGDLPVVLAIWGPWMVLGWVAGVMFTVRAEIA